MTIKHNFVLKYFTSIRIGGPAKYFIIAKTEKDLVGAIALAEQKSLPRYVLGEGSNMIVPDKGFRGVIIQNQIERFERRERVVKIGAGNNLLKLIFKLNRLGLAGLERMAGIPGTVGGAIYGAAGAYGQEIRDVLTRVRFFDGQRFRSISREQSEFGYRTSIFKKHKDWIITEAELKLGHGRPRELAKISREIIKLRAIKYKPGLKCPGSFFKNIKLADMPRAAGRKLVAKVESQAVKFGKLPAGYLLEKVSARGMKQGRVAVAHHHGNLIYNTGRGTARDVKQLAEKLKTLVKKKFGVIIEEEVQYL